MENTYYDEIMNSINSNNNITDKDGILYLHSDCDKVESIEYAIRASRILNLIKSETFKNNFNELPIDKQSEFRLALNSFLDDNIIDGYLPDIISKLAECDILYITNKYEVIDKLFDTYLDLIKSSGVVPEMSQELESDKGKTNKIYDKIIDKINEHENIVDIGDRIISPLDSKLLDNIDYRIRKIRFVRLIKSEKFKNNFIKLSDDDQLYICKYVETTMSIREYIKPRPIRPIGDRLMELLIKLTGVDKDYILAMDQPTFDLHHMFYECIKLPDIVSKIDDKENE